VKANTTFRGTARSLKVARSFMMPRASARCRKFRRDLRNRLACAEPAPLPRKSGVLTIERRVIVAISSTKHQAHSERLGTSTEQ
jgi:hypothetical protein